MSYKSLAYNQPGGTFYTCSIPALDIIDRLDIRRRKIGQNDGIQREDDERRVNAIAKYAETPDCIFPTPIIVSAYADSMLYENGMIVFKDYRKPVGHILDGQHRILGLRKASKLALQELELQVVFVFEIDTYSEATIFVTINSNQKQVSKSLMYDLFELNPNRSEEKTLHEIVSALNSDPESSFFKRIKILGKKIGSSETLSQAAFIEQILKAFHAKDSPLIEFYNNNEDTVLYKIIQNCFDAISQAVARVSHAYPEDYFFKTSGFGGIAQSLNDLVKIGLDRKDLSVDFFYGIFQDFLRLHPEPPGGTGNSAMLEIKRGIIEVLTVRG